MRYLENEVSLRRRHLKTSGLLWNWRDVVKCDRFGDQWAVRRVRVVKWRWAVCISLYASFMLSSPPKTKFWRPQECLLYVFKSSWQATLPHGALNFRFVAISGFIRAYPPSCRVWRTRKKKWCSKVIERKIYAFLVKVRRIDALSSRNGGNRETQWSWEDPTAVLEAKKCELINTTSKTDRDTPLRRPLGVF